VAYGNGLADRVRAAAPDGVDVILDAVGGAATPASVELVADRHRIGTIIDDQLAADYGVRVVLAGRSPALRLPKIASVLMGVGVAHPGRDGRSCWRWGVAGLALPPA
jgi:enoyl reductase